ncbi:MAG: PKD domain-containing protein [Bacteroidota bacterium]
MKALSAGFAILIIFSFGCRKEPADFYACFEVYDQFVPLGAPIHAANCSKNVDRVEWDFGDGSSSTVFSPIHSYTTKGSYKITLTAFRDNEVKYEEKKVAIGDSMQVDCALRFSGITPPSQTDSSFYAVYLTANNVPTLITTSTCPPAANSFYITLSDRVFLKDPGYLCRFKIVTYNNSGVLDSMTTAPFSILDGAREASSSRKMANGEGSFTLTPIYK